MISHVLKALRGSAIFSGLLTFVLCPALQAAPEDKATLVVWTDQNLKGESYSISVTPGDEKQASRTVGRSELQGKNLEGKISSARLICGSRKAIVSFSDYSQQFGHRLILECDPYQNKSIDFHDLKTHEGFYLSDKVAWYNLTVHAANHVSLDASVLGGLMWYTRVGEFIPEKASTVKGAKVYWVDSSHVRLEQNLKIDDPYCANQIVKLSIPINLTLEANPSGGWGVKAVMKADTYQLDFPDETCKAYQYDRLYAAVGRAIGPLNEGLKIFASKYASTYYFTASQYSDHVYGNWGNEP